MVLICQETEELVPVRVPTRKQIKTHGIQLSLTFRQTLSNFLSISHKAFRICTKVFKTFVENIYHGKKHTWILKTYHTKANLYINFIFHKLLILLKYYVVNLWRFTKENVSS